MAFVRPQERELQDHLNVIIFSDHGMTDIFWMDKVIELNKYISLNDLQQVKDRGPVVSLWPAPGKHSEARSAMRGGEGRVGQVRGRELNTPSFPSPCTSSLPWGFSAEVESCAGSWASRGT